MKVLGWLGFPTWNLLQQLSVWLQVRPFSSMQHILKSPLSVGHVNLASHTIYVQKNGVWLLFFCKAMPNYIMSSFSFEHEYDLQPIVRLISMDRASTLIMYNQVVPHYYIDYDIDIM
jgi:hypothetical protein